MVRKPKRKELSRYLQQSTATIASICFGILIGTITNQISGATVGWAVPMLAIVSLTGWLISRILPQQTEIEASIRYAQSLRTPEDRELYARQGLIGFVSLYNNPMGLTPEELKTAIDTLDFDRLKLERSNLEPMIHAIQCHANKLEHCWLLATTGQTAPGSLPYAHIVAEYMRHYRGVTCQFHYGKQYAISLDDDTDVLPRTYDLLVKRVFREARQYDLPNTELVADFTAGIRSMTLAMILACLDQERDIEFIGTRYTEAGKPAGELIPIIFSFFPMLKPDR